MFDACEKAIVVLGDDRAREVCVSVSGGADSDIIVDMVSKIRPDSRYVWFNTGMEYKATKEHLEYIENRYGIKIERIRAKFPVPLAVRKFGYPFLSKDISEHISRLQIHNFDWLRVYSNTIRIEDLYDFTIDYSYWGTIQGYAVALMVAAQYTGAIVPFYTIIVQ